MKSDENKFVELKHKTLKFHGPSYNKTKTPKIKVNFFQSMFRFSDENNTSRAIVKGSYQSIYFIFIIIIIIIIILY
jgi:hypothetical protein